VQQLFIFLFLALLCHHLALVSMRAGLQIQFTFNNSLYIFHSNIVLSPDGPRHHTAAATSTIPLRGISGLAGTVDVEGCLPAYRQAGVVTGMFPFQIPNYKSFVNRNSCHFIRIFVIRIFVISRSSCRRKEITNIFDRGIYQSWAGIV